MKMENPICSTLFDSRDLIEYREYLEDEIVDLYNDSAKKNGLDKVESLDQIQDTLFMDAYEVEFEHYKDVKGFIEELENCGDFEYGDTIIHRDYFTRAMRELCEDIGSIPKDMPYYLEDNIDWDGVAEDLRVDYMEAEFEGITYYMRS